jgi:hypothetical protein
MVSREAVQRNGAMKSHLCTAWLVAALSAGVAAADEVVKTYHDPAFAGSVAKILVVGAHGDRSVRGQFENAVARALRTAGAGGESSLSMGSASELSAANIVTAARSARADAVLVTQVVDIETQNRDPTATVAEYFDAYARYQDPLGITTTHTVRVSSELYLVDSQTKVWAAESTAVEKAHLFGVIDGIATALAAQLRSDGVIR